MGRNFLGYIGTFALAAAGTAMLAAAPTARASTILWDVDFGPGTDQSGAAVLGNPADVWTQESASNASGVTIYDSTGTSSNPLTLSWSAQNAGSYSGTATDPATTNLMESYIYTAGNPTFTLNGLAQGNYTLVVYAAGNANTQGSLGIYAGSSSTYTNDLDLGATSAASRQISAGAGVAYQEGTVTVDSSGNLYVTVLRTGSGSNPGAINGFQLQSVPEPASVGVGAIGVAGLLLRRRRSKLA